MGREREREGGRERCENGRGLTCERSALLGPPFYLAVRNYRYMHDRSKEVTSSKKKLDNMTLLIGFDGSPRTFIKFLSCLCLSHIPLDHSASVLTLNFPLH